MEHYVPHTKIKGDTVIAMIIAQAHQTLGHLGAQRTTDYIRRWYWWPKTRLGGRQVLLILPHLPGYQDQQSKAPGLASQPAHPYMTVGVNHYGLRGAIPLE